MVMATDERKELREKLWQFHDNLILALRAGYLENQNTPLDEYNKHVVRAILDLFRARFGEELDE